MGRVALVLGVQGQDGAILAERLLREGYEVFGGARNLDAFNCWRLESLGILSQVKLRRYDITDKESLRRLMTECTPSEVYMLAGGSKTYSSFYAPEVAISESVQGAANLFDLTVSIMPHVRVFIASSSEIFGDTNPGPGGLVSEQTSCFPINPYGLGKLCVLHMARQYRQLHKLFIVTGILFNHESSLRQKHFITRKISYNLARLKVDGGGSPFTLGNLNMERDWSSAHDFVSGIWQAMQERDSRDYVFASGVTTSVRTFLELAATAAGFDPVFTGSGLGEKCFCRRTNQVLAVVSMKHFREIDTPGFAGDITTAAQFLKWKPLKTVSDIAGEMVAADIERWSLGYVSH